MQDSGHLYLTQSHTQVEEAKLEWRKERLYTKGISIWSMSSEHWCLYIYTYAFDTNARFLNSFEFSCNLRSQGVPLNIIPHVFANSVGPDQMPHSVAFDLSALFTNYSWESPD